ncbi:CPBP family intramembrane glutamic endopeptidase [Undibacterium sp.]|jgi:membrane protease YdiL (CAAX protease family)|uniref:CPBP family intramembrane glutamic endopeptidase n=1 Tax=Undibacterium sp. TaxID=1914977 RepID=UPI002730556E|nr:CPBP family intramembrane glutamic endopeptidase [Undibacterium sp.]MDP1978461.1 CPBP family intramembrane metalloprotease [Undibacterium sp.]
MTPKHENFPSGLEACLLLVFLLGIEFMVGLLVQDSSSWTGISPDEVDAVIMVLSNAVLFTGVLHYKGMSYAELFHSSAVSRNRTLLLIVPVLLLVPGLEMVLGVLGGWLEAWQPVPDGQQRIFDDMMANGVHSIITACLVAPVLEEMLFRGLILRSFLQQYSRWVAILGSACLFGLAHMNIYQFLCATIVGVLCAWLYQKTRSLWPGIILHSASNGAAICVYRMTVSKGGNVAWQPTAGAYMAALLSAALGIYLLRRLWASDSDPGL